MRPFQTGFAACRLGLRLKRVFAPLQERAPPRWPYALMDPLSFCGERKVDPRIACRLQIDLVGRLCLGPGVLSRPGKQVDLAQPYDIGSIFLYILETLHCSLAQGAFAKLLTSTRASSTAVPIPILADPLCLSGDWSSALLVGLKPFLFPGTRIRRDTADCVAWGQIHSIEAT